MLIMPRMGFGGAMKGAEKGMVGGPGKGEENEERMGFEVKLEGFNAAAKIKVIKEVRAFTNLRLKEA
ncbi:hypothetical protein REPUB_Repub03eG0130000 [Reevesia pubescens]